MSFNLLETVKNYFTSEFVNRASSTLGESGANISKALSGIIPTGLAGILSKATSGNEGANSVFNMAKEAAGALPSSPNVSSLPSSQPGTSQTNLLSNLFGNNQSGIISVISRFAGIKDSSASSLLSMGIPAIMGLLGKHAEQNNLSASGLSGFLSSQKDDILNAMPSGLSSIAGMLGLGGLGSTLSSTASSVKSKVLSRSEDVAKKSGAARWVLPLIIILAAIGLVWYFTKGRNKAPETVASKDTTSVVQADTSSSVPTTAVTTTMESIKVKLPNGKELDAYKGGIEDQLVTFLSGDWKSMSDESLKSKWFNFDNLNFNTGKATLLPESEKQLNNIAEILKAFPDAKIKIGGYTDASGNAAANKKLSQDRAAAAKSGLEKLGVGVQVIGAEGYGSDFAKYPASASEEERVADRHVSISVRK